MLVRVKIWSLHLYGIDEGIQGGMERNVRCLAPIENLLDVDYYV